MLAAAAAALVVCFGVISLYYHYDAGDTGRSDCDSQISDADMSGLFDQQCNREPLNRNHNPTILIQSNS